MLSIVKSRRQKRVGQELAEIMEELNQARREVEAAQWRFHDALGQDQVDYAIYTLEAAEKKLEMLLRKAKRVWDEERRQTESERE